MKVVGRIFYKVRERLTLAIIGSAGWWLIEKLVDKCSAEAIQISSTIAHMVLLHF